MKDQFESASHDARGVVVVVDGESVSLTGLRAVSFGEVVAFERGALGRVVALERRLTRVELLDVGAPPAGGEVGVATGSPPGTIVGDGVLGRMVDALGRPLDEGLTIEGERRRLGEPTRPITRLAPAGPIFHTGVRQVDLLAPVRRGRATGVLAPSHGGKTCLATDILAAHDDPAARGVYVCPGLDRAAAAAVMLRRSGALGRTVVVSAPAASQALTRLAPHAGVALSRAFAAAGHPTMLVWDEVTEGDEAQIVTEHAGAWSEDAPITVLALAREPHLLDGRVDHLLVFKGRSFGLDLDDMRRGGWRNRHSWEGRRLVRVLEGGHEIEALLRLVPSAPIDDSTRQTLSLAHRLVREVLTQPPHSPEPIERALVRVWCVFAGFTCEQASLDALARDHGPLLAEVRRRGHLTQSLADALGVAITRSGGR